MTPPDGCMDVRGLILPARLARDGQWVPMSEQAPLQTFYDAVGGHATFVALVKRFYEGVAV